MGFWADLFKPSTTIENKEKEKVEQNALFYEKASELSEKYRPLLDQHMAYMDQYEKLYSVLMNSHMLKSEQGDRLISILIEDIKLFDKLKERDQEFGELYKTRGDEYSSERTSFKSFTRLAIVYEKREEYAKAAELCAQAIALGVTNDGTQGGMAGRLARICKKGNLELSNYLNINLL